MFSFGIHPKSDHPPDHDGDDDGDDDHPGSVTPPPNAPRDQISRAGNPSLRSSLCPMGLGSGWVGEFFRRSRRPEWQISNMQMDTRVDGCRHQY